jgi:hypothetical protein
MSVLKYKDPATGAWIPAPSVKVITEYVGGSAVGVPSDIVTEAERVASSIKTKIASNSLNFIALSDMHEFGDNDHSDVTIMERYRRANMNAGQGAKVVADNIDIDFFANLGDLAWGAKTSTVTDFVQSIVNARKYMYEVEKDHETFITPGNHDTGTYGFEQNGEYLSQAVTDGLIGTYRYVDFTTKKVRVICLNTAEVEGLAVSGSHGTERMTGTQLQWFADALDLSGKSNAAQWGIIILSHHPLDWGAILPAANCLNAYVTGANFSVTHNGIAVSKNFSGKNAAKVICQFHGHVHGFKVDNIRYGAVGSLQNTEVKRIAIPNACFARTNEYGENTAVDSNGIEFGETTSYEKDDNGTGKNTAFCVVSVDLDRRIIYADCFGAGYDRVISYGDEVVTTYSVTNNLSNATNSNGTATITEGARYSATITVDSGYELSSIKVTMGGLDITDTAVNGNNITIAEVTGNIVVTVTTTVVIVPPKYNNRVLTSIDTNGNPYNGQGYQEGYRLNSSGTTSQLPGAVNSGFIPYNGEVIRVYGTANGTIGNSGNYIVLYDSSFNKTLVQAFNTLQGYGSTWAAQNGKYMLTVDPDALNNEASKTAFQNAAYIRCGFAVCTGENFVVTLDEEIV